MDPQALEADEPPLLEVGDAARELGLSDSGVRAMVARGELRVFGRTRRGMRVFRQAEVLRARELRLLAREISAARARELLAREHR